MKPTRIIVMVIICLLMALSTYAFVFPMPISGSTDLGFVQVEVKNLRTDKQITTTTSGYGEFLVDWSNSDDERGTISRIRNGDVFQIKVLACNGNPKCVKEVVYGGEDDLFVEFDLQGLITKCECPDPSGFGFKLVIGLLSAVILVMGGGIKMYKNQSGSITAQHRHRGIRGYHDLNTLHKDPRYSHRRYKDSVSGFVADVKKIETFGGLI